MNDKIPASGSAPADPWSIANTTKEQRIELIRSWANNEEDGPEGCEVDLWELFRDYIDGKKEIAECNAAFQAEYYTEENT